MAERLLAHDYYPRSEVVTARHLVDQPLFPVIDAHNHLRLVSLLASEADPEDVVRSMDRADVELLVNLSGGSGNQRVRTIELLDESHPDRILYGSDLRPALSMYHNAYRLMETADDYFDWQPYPDSSSRLWKIYGLDLPDVLLKKVYHDNAVRVIGLAAD